MSRTYLDHASTSPLRPVAASTMAHWFERSTRGEVGDPSRSHHEGLVARDVVENSRLQVAALLGARAREVVFCSGATEAIATASYGVALARPDQPHTVFSSIEHSAVRGWAERGPHTAVGVDPDGVIGVEQLLGAIGAETGLVHLQWGNHEVGTLQDIATVAAECRRRGVLLHVDAAQAAGRVPIDFGASGIDLMSVSAHKFGGPTGTGALLVRRGLRLDPLIMGGDQERARRAGIENIAALAGFGAAADEAFAEIDDESAVARRLTQRVIEWADATERVATLGSRTARLPHIVCLTLDGIEPQPVLIGLDRRGIAVHSGNSCSSEALEPSPVLLAMGADAAHSLRISVGWSSTDAHIDHLLTVLPEVLAGLEALRR